MLLGFITSTCFYEKLGMSTGILFSFLTSEAMVGVPPEKKSTAMGFYQAVYALGITVLPMISGKIVGAWSMSYAYFALAGVCFVAAIGSRFIKDVK